MDLIYVQLHILMPRYLYSLYIYIFLVVLSGVTFYQLMELLLSLHKSNNTILLTPPHICSSEEIFPRRTLAQLRKIYHPSSSNHTNRQSTPNHIHHHYAPFVTLTYTTHVIFSTAPTYAPHCHPWICVQTPLE